MSATSALLEARVRELEAELADFKTGRRYCGGPQMDIASPIECLRRQTYEIANACGVTEADWARGWTVAEVIERAKRDAVRAEQETSR